MERRGTHYIGGWVGPIAVLDACGKSCPQQESNPVHGHKTVCFIFLPLLLLLLLLLLLTFCDGIIFLTSAHPVYKM